ncbi:MAG: hypothetical protein PHV82_17990, partial [Victivallaceae bacterium]|nr:hypothetical protein [Victivallaceae bacterium]
VEGSHGGSDPAIVSTFVNFVKHGVKTNTSPVAARNSVATGVLGHESMRKGNVPLDIPELPDYLLEYFANGQKK